MLSISIVTAVYNGEKTLRKCLDSVRNQSINAEHIVVDGASTDSTLKIIEQYKTGNTKVISEPDKGIYDAMNKGIALATGDIVGILNADDYYPENDVLENVLQMFEDQHMDACYGDLVYVDIQKPSKIRRYWRTLEYNQNNFYWGWMPPHPTFFVRRSVYEKFGVFRLDFGTAADYELMLRFLLKHGISATYIPRVLVHMRSGGASNESFINRIKANRVDRSAWKVNELKPYPWTLWVKPLRKLGQWFVKPPVVSESVVEEKDGEKHKA